MCVLSLYCINFLLCSLINRVSFTSPPPSPTQNRELQIMRRLEHCNIVRLRYFFYSGGVSVHFTQTTHYNFMFPDVVVCGG